MNPFPTATTLQRFASPYNRRDRHHPGGFSPTDPTRPTNITYGRHRMHRFFHPNLPHPRSLQQAVMLDDDESRHARRVLRLNVGDEVELFDGEGRRATGVIETLRPAVVVRLTHIAEVPAPKPAIDLFVAMPKGGRADDMVHQLVQLGADQLTPLLTSRTSVDPRDAKLDRLNRIVVESTKQCGRSHLMRINPAMELTAALTHAADLRLTAALQVPTQPDLHATLPDQLRAATRVQVLIGPEGGWTPAERDQMVAAGCMLWQFNPHTLRIATAACAATAILRYLTR